MKSRKKDTSDDSLKEDPVTEIQKKIDGINKSASKFYTGDMQKFMGEILYPAAITKALPNAKERQSAVESIAANKNKAKYDQTEILLLTSIPAKKREIEEEKKSVRDIIENSKIDKKTKTELSESLNKSGFSSRANEAIEMITTDFYAATKIKLGTRKADNIKLDELTEEKKLELAAEHDKLNFGTDSTKALLTGLNESPKKDVGKKSMTIGVRRNNDNEYTNTDKPPEYRLDNIVEKEKALAQSSKTSKNKPEEKEVEEVKPRTHITIGGRK